MQISRTQQNTIEGIKIRGTRLVNERRRTEIDRMPGIIYSANRLPEIPCSSPFVPVALFDSDLHQTRKLIATLY